MLVKTLDWMSMILLIIGGLNLGVVGLFNYDPIIHFSSEYLFLMLAHVFFFLIGLAALYMIFRISQLIHKISSVE